RGLLFTSPIVLVGIVAAVAMVRDRGAHARRRDALVAVVVMGAYLLLFAGWTDMPFLEEPGPRFLIPAIPFLAVPLAWAWSRWSAVCRTTAAYGVAVMLVASTTFLLIARGDAPLHDYLHRVAHHEFLPTVWSIGLGRVGGVV